MFSRWSRSLLSNNPTAEWKEGVEFGQYLYEIYNHGVELRVSKAGVNLLLIRWMKDLEKIFYGNIVAYDSAPCYRRLNMMNLPMPCGALDVLHICCKNIFSEDGSPIPSDAAAQSTVHAIARYACRECYCLSMTDKGDNLLWELRVHLIVA